MFIGTWWCCQFHVKTERNNVGFSDHFSLLEVNISAMSLINVPCNLKNHFISLVYLKERVYLIVIWTCQQRRQKSVNSTASSIASDPQRQQGAKPQRYLHGGAPYLVLAFCVINAVQNKVCHVCLFKMSWGKLGKKGNADRDEVSATEPH